MPLRADLEPSDYLKIILRRKWVIVFAVLSVSCGVLFYLINTPPLYKSSTTILIIPQKVSDTYIRSTGSGWIEERLNTIQPLITSRTRLMKVINELGLFKGTPKRPRPSEDVLVVNMRKRIELTVNRTDSFTLSFVHEDPSIAMLATKMLANFFMEENQKTREGQAEETSRFLDIQLKEAKEKLERQEENMRQYKYRYLDELPQQVDSGLAKINQLQSQNNTLNEKLRLAEEKKESLEIRERSLNKILLSVVNDNEAPVPRNPHAVASDQSETATPTFESAQSPQMELSRKQARLDELSQKYTDSFPEIRQLNMEIRQLEERLGYSGKGNATKEGKNRKPEESRKSQMNQYYKRLMAPEIEDKFFLRGEILKSAKEISALKREIGENNSNVNKIQAKIKNAPIREQEMLNLTRDYENKKRLYDDIKKKKFDFDMSEAIEKQQEDARFQILDPANLPKTPFSPDVRRIIQIALMAAIALGFGGVFTLEALDTKIRGTKDFRHYSHLPVFATIPVIKEMKYSRVSTIKTLAIGGGMVLIIISISLLFVIFYAKTGKTLFSLGGIG